MNARSRRPRGVDTSGCASSVSTSSTDRYFGSVAHARGGWRSSAGFAAIRRPMTQVSIESARGGDDSRHRAGRHPCAHQRTDERLQRRPIEIRERDAAAGGKSSEMHQIAGIAFNAVRSQPPLDAQVIEIAVHEGGRSPGRQSILNPQSTIAIPLSFFFSMTYADSTSFAVVPSWTAY